MCQPSSGVGAKFNTFIESLHFTKHCARHKDVSHSMHTQRAYKSKGEMDQTLLDAPRFLDCCNFSYFCNFSWEWFQLPAVLHYLLVMILTGHDKLTFYFTYLVFSLHPLLCITTTLLMTYLLSHILSLSLISWKICSSINPSMFSPYPDMFLSTEFTSYPVYIMFMSSITFYILLYLWIYASSPWLSFRSLGQKCKSDLPLYS